MSEAPARIWAWKWNAPGARQNNKKCWRDYPPQFETYTHYGSPTWKHWRGEPTNYEQNPVEYVRADRIEELEARLDKAVEALDEAVYLLAPDEEDMAKKAGVYRVVTTFKELKGETDE